LDSLPISLCASGQHCTTAILTSLTLAPTKFASFCAQTLKAGIEFNQKSRKLINWQLFSKQQFLFVPHGRLGA
jgi:hypothetical protein